MKRWEDLLRVQVPDLFCFAYFSLLLLVVAASGVVFTRFVESKPDGRKTVIGNYWMIFINLLHLSKIDSFSAKVNLLSCQVLCCCTILFYVFILLRLIIGPFTYAGVVVVHYWVRITLVSFLIMLTFKTFLKILFILEFNRMTSIPDNIIIRFMWMSTSIFTLAHMGLEITTREKLGYHHFGRLCFNLFLGKVCLNTEIITGV